MPTTFRKRAVTNTDSGLALGRNMTVDGSEHGRSEEIDKNEKNVSTSNAASLFVGEGLLAQRLLSHDAALTS